MVSHISYTINWNFGASTLVCGSIQNGDRFLQGCRDCEMGPRDAVCQNKHSPGPNGVCLLFVDGRFLVKNGLWCSDAWVCWCYAASVSCVLVQALLWCEQSPVLVLGGGQRAGLDTPEAAGMWGWWLKGGGASLAHTAHVRRVFCFPCGVLLTCFSL